MSKLNIKYGLNEVPPFWELILFSAQWLVITVPIIIIIGKVIANLHFDHTGDQVIYIQKLFFVIAVTLLVQLFWGHRLPLIIGPSSVLLIGIAASQGSSIPSIYTSISIGGIVLFVFGVTGLFGYLKKLFTPRVVATILILIALTLTPLMIDLITQTSLLDTVFSNIVFAFVFIICMFAASRILKGIWKSTLIIWAIIAGSLIYFLISPWVTTGLISSSLFSSVFRNLNLAPSFNLGIIISFLICFLALSINDLGSIQSVGELVNPDHMQKRITRGVSVTGLANILAGLFGVVGPVNFSLTPGVIASTGCASRYTLLPTGFSLLLLSFMPSVLAFIGSIPSLITGSIIIYIMCSQISSGLLVAFNSMDGFKFEHGLTMGLPLMLGLIISFLPAEVVNTFPLLLKPIIGNGFVVGVISVLIMEHVIFKNA
ncbi:MAG: uracil-xanthine permease family protein [Bacillota bacterium]